MITIKRPKGRRHQKKQLKKTQIFLMFLMFCMTGLIGYLSYLVAAWTLPTGRVVLLVLSVLLCVILFVKYYFNWSKTTVLLQVIYCTVSGLMLFQSVKVYHMIQTINGNFSQLQYKLKVLTLNSSSIFTLPQVNTAILAPAQVDEPYIQQLIKDIGSNTNTAVSLKETSSYMSAYQALVAKEYPAIIMNSAEEPIIYRQYPNYYQTVKSIYEYTNQTKETVQLGQFDGTTQYTLFGIMAPTWNIKADAPLTSAILYTKNVKTGGIGKNTVDLTTPQTMERNGQSTQVSLGELGLFSKSQLVEAINKQEHVTINHMVLVDYIKLLDLLDIFNTITVQNDTEFYSRENNITFSKGTLSLNKEQTRLFMADTSEGFNQRQQIVVSALLQQVGHRMDTLAHEKIMTVLASAIKSDMALRDLIRLLTSFN